VPRSPLSSMPNTSCSSRTCAPIAAKSTWSTRPPANCCAPSQRGSPSCPTTGRAFAAACSPNHFTGEDPLLRHVRTRVKSPQTNGVIERFFGTLKYEHLYRGPINDGDALAVEVNRFRQIYNTIRPHQALHDHTPRDAYLAGR
jgi:putative transposase